MSDDLLAQSEFDFVQIVFEKLKTRFEEGLSKREFHRLCGILFSLPREKSKLILDILCREYGVNVEQGWISLK